VTYDRDEWRRSWGPDDTPDLRPPAGAGGGRARASARTAARWPSAFGATREAEAETRQADTAAGTEADTASGTEAETASDGGTGSHAVGPESGEGGGTDEPVVSTLAAASAAAGRDTVPLTRFPQPPPAGWDDASEGPGSPAGSVRPPDTTGTVDAPGKRPRRTAGLFVALLAGLLGAAIGTGVTLALLLPEERTETVTAPSIEVNGDAASVVPAVAQAVTPSVVRIDVVGVPIDSPLGAPEGAPALGSGVIYRSDGYILTNHHVIDGADEVTVRLSSGDNLDAEVVGSDELNDLAVLRVDRTGLPAVNIRSVDEPLVVGETVVAIGSPFGLDASVTSGIISALNRDLQVPSDAADGLPISIPSVVQTDAAINPGNSGGALVDAQGRLVGINTAILSRSGASQGVGFAVSAEAAISSADQLIEQGFVSHPLLGILGGDVTPAIAEDFGLETERGAVVQEVQDGTGAADADVRASDIVVAVDGDRIDSMAQLVAEVRRRSPGDVVTLTVIRDGEELDVDVVLGERPR
jgi:S1-C subfamily serine protease